MTDTILSRRLPEAYGVRPSTASPYWAFAHDGGTLFAWRILGASFREDRASISTSVGPWVSSSPVLVRDDPSETVGPASLLYRDSSASRIVLWDVNGAAVYEHTVAGSLQLSPPLWLDGWVYWVEMPLASEATLSTASFYRCRGDLADPELLVAHVADTFPVSVQWNGPGNVWAVGSTFYFEIAWLENIQMEAVGSHGLSFPLSGGSATDLDLASIDVFSHPLIGIPQGSAVLGGAGGELWRRTGGHESSWQKVWPDTSTWTMDLVYNVGVSDTTSSVILYGLVYGEVEDDPTLIRATVGASGSPSSVISPVVHPTALIPPMAIFPED